MTSALALGQAIAEGLIDPRELTQTALSAANGADNVFITLLKERAEAEAHAAALRQKAGCLVSPLDGVPFAWKDLVDIKGTVTTAGSGLLARHRTPAMADAPLVNRSAMAGLVSIGKVNLTELAFSALGLNPTYGTPINPADARTPRVSGGSSSGSAVAVAKGIVPAAMGSDTGGSLRVPAAFNGLVSYRPSCARHDGVGITPLGKSFDVPGVLATSVADCFAIDDCMRVGQVQTRQTLQPSSIRLLVDEAVLDEYVTDPAVRRNLLTSVEQLAEQGVAVSYGRVPAVGQVIDLIAKYGWLGGAEGWVEYRWLVEADTAGEMDQRVKQRLLAASQMSGEKVISLYRQRVALIQAVEQELEGALLVLPTVGHVAPPIAPLEADPAYFADINLKTLRLTMVGSFLDMPTLALPTGLNSERQFTSLQISAPQGDDERLAASALTLFSEPMVE
ncbi:amidase family protein [Spiribacter salilacus]|uniref:amidase family protein n=1 Tax=Spiribacter salilacus TaxID=2664894 RepID=UPI00129B984B